MARRVLGAVTVFAGASSGADGRYADRVAALGRHLAQSGITVVYGGDNLGLMKVVADAALAADGTVYGVIPEALAAHTGGHPGLTSLEVVPDLHARKRRMADLCDAFIAVPGGVGTLEELFEAWTWATLGIHAKPVAIYDVEGFWAPLSSLLDHLVTTEFLSPTRRSSLLVADSPEAVVAALTNPDSSSRRP